MLEIVEADYERWTCRQCGYIWMSKNLPCKPLTCPSCHSSDWEKE